MNRIVCCLILAAATTLASPAAAAQGSVTIFGSVTDGSGAAVPGARITATRAQTGSERVAVSDASGNYVISPLPVGTYTVKAELTGFKTFAQEQIQVQIDENRRVNVVLELGPLAESVTVAGESAQVDIRTGTLREVVDSQRIVELPLNGRNPLQFNRVNLGNPVNNLSAPNFAEIISAGSPRVMQLALKYSF